MTNGYNCYLKYVAIKLHFSQKKYDYFLYDGSLRTTSYHTYENRTDKTFFKNLSKTIKNDEIELFFAANFFHRNIDLWIGDIIDDRAQTIYKQSMMYIENMSYEFSKDCKTILDLLQHKDIDFDSLFVVKPNYHPPLLQLVLQRYVQPETFIIFEHHLEFFKNWSVEINDMVVWPEFKQRCEKYKPFLFKYIGRNITSCRTIMQKLFVS